MAQLSEASRRFLERPYLAHVATVTPSGRPQLSPVWVDVDGDDILFNTAEGRAKTKDLRSNPTVALSVLDPADHYNVLLVTGTVVEMSPDGADEHIEQLAQKYTGAPFAGRVPGQQRVKVRIRVDKVLSEPRAEDGGTAQSGAESEG
jgi:PPOX class probable F420-dependent enzyme